MTLSLARSGGPRALLTDAQTLRHDLLEQVLFAAYPDPGDCAHATYWLGWLADKLGRIPELSWWEIPRWIPRWQVGLVGAFVGGLLVGTSVSLTWLFLLALRNGLNLALIYFREQFAVGLIMGLISGLIVGLVSGLRIKDLSPRSMAIQWPKRQDLPSVGWMVLGIGLFIFLAVGLLTTFAPEAPEDETLVEALSVGLIAGLQQGLTVGISLGVPLGLLQVWRTPLAENPAATPRSVYQGDVRSQIASGLMAGLIGWEAGWLIAESSQISLAFQLVFWLTFGLTLGLVSCLVSGLRAAAAPSLLFTEIALLPNGHRVRFMPLLETALERQVLRQAGTVYQFRHADLQDRLAELMRLGSLPIEPPNHDQLIAPE